MPLAPHAETVFNLAPPSPAPRETANQDEIAAAYPAGAATSPEAGHPNPAGIPQPGRAATQGEAPPDDPSSDALRDYRFALARAAQAYKRYPTLARERGQEGTAQVRLIWKRGVVQFVLQKTSGHPLLDEAALTMLRQAISHTPLPKTLQDTPFSLDLPIEYSLNPP
jgi:protein TonB